MRTGAALREADPIHLVTYDLIYEVTVSKQTLIDDPLRTNQNSNPIVSLW